MIYGTLLLHVLLLLVFIAFIFRKSWGRESIEWISRHTIVLSFFLSLGAVIGSFLYSLVLGYEPCELCWWQRVFLYPLLPIFAVALYKKRTDVYDYVLPLVSVAGILALYHTYIQLGGTSSILPCTAAGGACTKVYVLAFGYITIPTMSLTVVLWIILLAFLKRNYDKNRYA